MTSLNLKSLRKVRSGSVAILENSELCFASEIEWQQLMRSSTGTVLLQRNARREDCRKFNNKTSIISKYWSFTDIKLILKSVNSMLIVACFD